jgi:hypothetical protein
VWAGVVDAMDVNDAANTSIEARSRAIDRSSSSTSDVHFPSRSTDGEA